eukprot:COSAG05_NODE_21_length_32397_cov_125.224008_6_plen_441_part_00
MPSLNLGTCSILQQFEAHRQDVKCLQLGRKSGQVLVTGGDDFTVNMWAVGKPEPIISLHGHQSPIACVAFDSNEEVVVAGADAGTLKLWDLENSKVMKTLTGHRAGCISVDFHPFGEYFASGSLDANLKVWDVRKKNCIVTYKGHTQGVEHVKISPDGRWVVSGSQDGVVKLWDLRAGKLMSDFQHDAPVTSLDFHPNFFQLATGCADCTARVWDLESLQLLHHTAPEAAEISSVRYCPDGLCLVTTSRDCLKSRLLEPHIPTSGSVAVCWDHFGDLAFNADQLVACTMSAASVAVWVVTLDAPESSSSRGLDAQSNVVDSRAEHDVGLDCHSPLQTAEDGSAVGSATKHELPTNARDVNHIRPPLSRTVGADGSGLRLGRQHSEVCTAMAARLANLQVRRFAWVLIHLVESAFVLVRLMPHFDARSSNPFGHGEISMAH